VANRRGTKVDVGRMTKAERKDEARRQRIEIERRMARARRNRWIALGVAFVLAAGVAVFVVTRPKPASTSSSPADLLAASADASKTAGCSAVRTVAPYQPETDDRAHIGVGGSYASLPPLSTYRSIPPTSGPHNQTPLGSGVYSSPPPIDQAIHSLEHGATIVWYAPDVTGNELSRIETFYRRGSVGSRVIVAPYDYPDQGAAGSLPSGIEMALVSWHHLETCARANLSAAFGFTARYAAPPFGQQKYLGDAPEAGAAI
jgi:hypothetical protein